jgi:hypothetical protein
MLYVEEALDRIEKNPTLDPNNQGILEKLLKIDRQTAVIMAHDMLLAGVDTVYNENHANYSVKPNVFLFRPLHCQPLSSTNWRKIQESNKFSEMKF